MIGKILSKLLDCHIIRFNKEIAMSSSWPSYRQHPDRSQTSTALCARSLAPAALSACDDEISKTERTQIELQRLQNQGRRKRSRSSMETDMEEDSAC